MTMTKIQTACNVNTGNKLNSNGSAIMARSASRFRLLRYRYAGSRNSEKLSSTTRLYYVIIFLTTTLGFIVLFSNLFQNSRFRLFSKFHSNNNNNIIQQLLASSKQENRHKTNNKSENGKSRNSTNVTTKILRDNYEPERQGTELPPPSISNTTCIPNDLKYLVTSYTKKLCTMNNWNLTNNPNAHGLTCQYPQLNPFDSVISQFQGELIDKDVCEIFPEFQNTSFQIFTTDFKSNLITLIPPSHFGYSTCCYRNMSRVKGDDSATAISGKCTPITSPKQKIPPEHEFIKIFCNPKSKTSMQRNHSSENATNKTSKELIGLFAFAPLKSDVESRVENLFQKNKTKNVEETLNIAILGLDSISHMNFIRTMPKSYEYIIEEMKALGLYGYNKVGENTFANLIPILTGLHPEQMAKVHPKCKIEDGPYDDCPFLWQEFAASGFRTIYGEDAAFLSMFHYAKNGFKSPPTDYYLRPFIHESDEMFYWGTNRSSGDFPCYAGTRLNLQYILDYMRSTAEAMGRDKRYFELLWANSLSHSHLHWPVAGDTTLLESLAWFKNSSSTNPLNNTLLIVMSDHGMRYGGIRDTLQGRIEESMPFAFFIFPQWFKKKYARALENFEKNKYRLTTPFDVHYTLKDLLNLEQIENLNIEKRAERINSDLAKNILSISNSSQSDVVRYGISLFLPMPITRVCSEAGIPDNYCICHRFKPVENFTQDPVVALMAKHLVVEINNKLKAHVKCAKLKLDKILGAEKVVVPGAVVKSVSEKIEDLDIHRFTVTIMTDPGGATFESRFRLDSRSNVTTLEGDISRTNMYKQQSHCVNEYSLKSFCFCVDQ